MNLRVTQALLVRNGFSAECPWRVDLFPVPLTGEVTWRGDVGTPTADLDYDETEVKRWINRLTEDTGWPDKRDADTKRAGR